MSHRGATAARAWLLAAVACAVLAPAEGSYRFGTLNWKLVTEPGVAANTVDFELVTAWRRDFSWVYVSQREPAGCAAPPCRTLDDKPIVGDKLRVTGLSFADETGAQALTAGTSEILFHTGDAKGTTYFVDVDVTSFSESDNWVMGVTKIRHTYSAPYKGKDSNIYPAGYSYEASTGAALDANQPFTHTPWTASFAGCCRWEASLDANSRKPYKVVTHIDMTDRNNSPAARTLPIITVPQARTNALQDQPRFFVMAKDQYVPGAHGPAGHAAVAASPIVGQSGGTTNYDADNDESAPLTYKIAQAADLMLDKDDQCAAPPCYTPYGHIEVIDSATGEMRMRTNLTGGALAVGYYQAAVRVDSCSSRPGFNPVCRGGTVIDFMVRVVPNGAGNDGKLPMPVDVAGNAYTSPLSGRETHFGWVGYDLSAHVRIDNPRGNKVVLNYVFAGLTVEGSSASNPNAVQYSESEMSHQGMPAGAKLFSTARGNNPSSHGVVEVAISFDNPYQAHRPGHDAAMNKDKLDFSSAPNAKTLWDKGFRPVLKPRHKMEDIKPEAIDSTISLAAFDMNTGTGGAAVYLWLRRDPEEAAVTELAISHCESEVEEFKRKGFEMLPQNVNEQSKSVSVVNVWYKKGTGPAITDVMLVDQAIDSEVWCNSTKMSVPGIHICGASTNPPTRPYTMYVMSRSQSAAALPLSLRISFVRSNHLACVCASRLLTACAAAALSRCGGYSLVSGNLNYGPGQVLSGRGAFMYVKHAPDAHLRRVLKWTPEKAGHYIFCYAGAEPDHPQISSTQRCIDLDIKEDPAPLFDVLQPLSTYMGKVLEFTISYVDINHPHEQVHISMVQTMPMLTGFKMVGAPTVTVLDAHGNPYSGAVPQRMARTAQVVQWFPDATYGGYKDDVCFNGTDADGSALRQAQTKVGCVNIFVERCQWYVQTEDTLIQVRFGLRHVLSCRGRHKTCRRVLRCVELACEL